jgi:hypothetical protein
MVPAYQAVDLYERTLLPIVEVPYATPMVTSMRMLKD